ncbi:MAG: BatA domain-containing protein [Planctomycetes bacterium]|nr:BatA domain-containing protein [Planctomycetota bacterium]
MIPQFVHPLLLWGAAAAAVPVVIHLLHRRRFHRQRWAAMEWLLQAAKQNQKRLQMENLLLLLVRTLAVLFLALAITRPTFSDAPMLLGPARATHLYVVLDNSGSMAARSGTRTTFDDALSGVSTLVAALGENDPVSVVLTNANWDQQRQTGRPQVILRDTTDHATVRRRLGELKPAPARADLADALKLIEESVPATAPELRRVAIVSDLQEISLSGQRDRNSTDDPIRQSLLRLRDKGAEVVLVPVGRDIANVAITALRPAEERDVVQGSTAIFQAEVRNYSDRPQKVEVRFTVDGEERGETSQWVNVPARTAGPDAPPAATAQYYTTFRPEDVGVHVIEARIRADGLTFDDARAFAFAVRPRIQVLAVDPDLRSSDPNRAPETYWLKPALSTGDDGPFQVTQMPESEYHGLRTLNGWDIVVFANVERPAPDEASRTRLEEFVKAGGALFLTVGDHVVPQRWNEEIYRREGGLLPAALGSPKVDPQAVLRLDLKASKHAILQNIADPEFAVFFESPVLFGRMTLEGLEAEKDTRVALAYDDLARSPALVEKRFGRGRVLLYTSTVDDGWGRLPGSYVFPALLHETAYWLTSRGDADRNLAAFQPWTRAVPPEFASIDVACADGTTEKPEKDTASGPGSVVVSKTGTIGIYRAVMQLKAQDLLGRAPPAVKDAFTVNFSPLESDLRRIDPAEVLARYKDLIRTGGDAAAAADAVKAKAGEIAVPLLFAALLCLVIEVLLVQRIGRRRAK